MGALERPFPERALTSRKSSPRSPGRVVEAGYEWPAIGFVLSRAEAEEMMYRTAYLARESSGDFTVVLTFALLGLALSLLAIGRGGLIDPEYMADLLLLF
jgi:hypothetical protein